MTRTIAAAAALLLLLAGGVRAQPSSDAEPLIVSLPDIDWSLEIHAPGFEVKSDAMSPKGEGTRTTALNAKDAITLSAFLGHSPTTGTATDARAYYWGLEMKEKERKEDIRMEDFGRMALVFYTVPLDGTRRVDRRTVSAYMAKGGIWADIQLSQDHATPETDARFREILRMVRFNDAYEADVFTAARFGTSGFMNADYAQAARHLKRSLDADATSRSLVAAEWIVIADRYGMALCRLGRFAEARDFYTAALKREGAFPMFHYNMAAAQSGLGDSQDALKSLTMAQRFAVNMPSGVRMPDPSPGQRVPKPVGQQRVQRHRRKNPRAVTAPRSR